MDSKKIKQIICLIGLIVLGILLIVGTVTALRPEYIGDTYVVWNITNTSISKAVSQVSINGIYIENPDPNAHWVVSDGLEPNTKAAILVHYVDGTVSRCWTTTLQSPATEQENFFHSINMYFFLGLLITILVIAFFTYREFGFIVAVLSIVGFTNTLDYGFGLAFSYVIVFIVSMYVVFGTGD